MSQLTSICDENKSKRITLQWDNINFGIISKDAKRSSLFKKVEKSTTVLQNISGTLHSGQLLAIMGHSGCGKTSLLNVLAARVSKGGSDAFKLSGKILINGIERNDRHFRKISAYVLQDDALYAHLTVLETLTLAAHFYLPTSVSADAKQELVVGVLKELGLIKVKDTIIGNEKVRGVSGGERKRVNIACQLVSDPLIFFLDEPTSGLDSFQALSVMQALKDLSVKQGRIVVTVIHQPRSSIFEMFDQILLLSGGRTMYLGKSHEAIQYFNVLGYPCPKLLNPADYFLDILSPDSRTSQSEEETAARITLLHGKWNETAAAAAAAAAAKPTVDNNITVSSDSNIASSNALVVNDKADLERVYRNFTLLAWRAWTEQSRNVPVFIIKIVATTFFALIIGGIYSNTSYDQKSINNRVGLLFVISINQGFNGVIGVLNTFPKEKVIVNRERSSDAYTTLPYFAAKYIVEMPLNTIPCIVFTCILYYLANLNPDRFGYHMLILMLEALTAVSLGLATSAIAPSLEAALAIGPPLVIIALLFGGFYINIDSLPIVANYIPYMSFLRWTFAALCINEFEGVRFNCDNGFGSCLNTGAEVIKNLSFTGDCSHNVFGLGMVCLGFTLSAYLLLENSKIQYVPLGFVGSKHVRWMKND